MLLATYTLWLRDIVRFLRQRSRIVGAFGTPVIFWLLLGSGLGTSFRMGPTGASGRGYLEYFYPGALALMVLFTAIFSTISVIEDRHEGFLQGVLVAPVPRGVIVAAKVLAGATLACMQAAVFLVLAPAAGIRVSLAVVPAVLLVLLVLALALTALGFTLAWVIDSTQGFHGVMNLLLFPMWVLSGAVFPAAGAADWIKAIMVINPMTYGISALRNLLTGEAAPLEPGTAVSVVFILVFGLLATIAGTLVVGERRV
jgi:ABC-2 type transport system permease protein